MAASANSSVPNSWDGVVAAARSAGAKYPELVAAQSALESGWGKHTSGKHNDFGLKGTGIKTKTIEYVKGEPMQVEAPL